MSSGLINFSHLSPKLTIIFLAIIAAFHLQGQRISIKKDSIDHYISSEMKKWKVPGCAIAIIKGNGILYTQGYGFRNVENRLPVTPQTVFKIASCTKSFTAAAAGLLVDQKILEWDTPIKYYLPRLELINAGLTEKVTLRDLLNHRTGLYDDDWSWVGDHVDAERLFEILSSMPQHQTFRNGYSYSNMAYALVGYLEATQNNSTWRDLIRMNFLEPLSMTSTLFSHNEQSGLKDFAYGYEFTDSTQSYTRGDLSEHFTDSLSVCEAFGFISSTAEDLSHWISLFICGGKWEGKTVIPPVVFSELVKPVNYINKPPETELSEEYYCMGWFRNSYKLHPLLQHSGGLQGFKSYMSFMPADSIGIVVLTNGQAYRFPEALTYDLYDLVLGLRQTHWSERFINQGQTASVNSPDSIINFAGTYPSKPLREYTGTYYSKWLGAMKVSMEGGQLYFQFHRYPKELMHHAHYNTFYTEAERKPGSGITFQLNHDGNVYGLQLNEFTFEKIK